MMTSRERMLTALNNGRPDRLPCQVHGWMDYYLQTYLNGLDWWQAYDKFEMDFAIYASPRYLYSDKSLADWQVEKVYTGTDRNGNRHWEETITTPEGILYQAGAENPMTGWVSTYIVKNEHDFYLWHKYRPLPIQIDFREMQQLQGRLGDRGIIRSHPFSAGQGSPWQSFCMLTGTENAIFMTAEQAPFVHHALQSILDDTLKVSQMWEGIPSDMIELGGGAGSSTVISPALFREFCLPYDQRQIALFQEIGLKVVYHLCGGVMPMLDLAAETGADGLETMTPPSMGGDCDLKEASRRVGDRLFFIGGFDQNAGFEHGTKEIVRQLVFACFEATIDHAGYILCPSDHFFHGAPENIKAFAEAAKECIY
jgi:uroporphyrinogen decarboxylase